MHARCPRTYKEDPVIFGWELMNEPRNYDDSSGDTLQAWINEMSAFVKSVDSQHMLAVGSEGEW
jgi:mannan endo-1,4-beta-mannosidase